MANNKHHIMDFKQDSEWENIFLKKKIELAKYNDYERALETEIKKELNNITDDLKKGKYRDYEEGAYSIKIIFPKEICIYLGLKNKFSGVICLYDMKTRKCKLYNNHQSNSLELLIEIEEEKNIELHEIIRRTIRLCLIRYYKSILMTEIKKTLNNITDDLKKGKYGDNEEAAFLIRVIFPDEVCFFYELKYNSSGILCLFDIKKDECKLYYNHPTLPLEQLIEIHNDQLYKDIRKTIHICMMYGY